MFVKPLVGIRHISHKYPNVLKYWPSLIKNIPKSSMFLHKVPKKHTMEKKRNKKAQPYFSKDKQLNRW